MTNVKIRFGLWSLCLLGGLAPSWADSVFTNLTDLGAARIEFSEAGSFGFGQVVSGAGDFDGDGKGDIAISAPLYDRGGFDEGFNNGAVFVLSGEWLNREQNLLELTPEGLDHWVFFGPVESRLGSALAAVGDVNRDGLSDVAMASESGSIGTILYGRTAGSGVVSLEEPAGQGMTVTGAGNWVASAGDVNGDGCADVLFGRSGSENAALAGATLIWGASDWPPALDVSSPGPAHRSIPFSPNHPPVASAFGLDVNGDGFSELGLLSPIPGSPARFFLSLVPGRADPGERVNAGWNFRFGGDSIRPAGDLNGDGFSDYVVGISGVADAAPSARIFFGGEFPSPRGPQSDVLEWIGKGSSTILGSEQAYGVGDLNGDGIDDLAVGMPDTTVTSLQADKILTGRVLFLLGKSDWPRYLAISKLLRGEVPEMDAVIVDGVESNSLFGYSIAGAGDLQGDGYDDVIVGAPLQDLLSNEAPGSVRPSVYVLQGRSLFFLSKIQRSRFHLGVDSATVK